MEYFVTQCFENEQIKWCDRVVKANADQVN